MPKIAIIGAGSLVFTKTLTLDILSTPALEESELVLMSRTEKRLAWAEDYSKRVISENRLGATVSTTTDRSEALEGADYVIAMLKVGGNDASRKDYEIPLSYGVDQCVGDTLSAGGVMRSARTIPVMVDIARDMERLCPHALLLNYVNPMAAVCMAIGKATGISFLGLCHGVQTTLDLLARYTDLPKEEVDFLCAGINHMAWFLKLERDGRDLYPLLRERIEKPEYYLPEKVRCEVMRHFGYFMTESTGHLSEYLPYFRKSSAALDRYCDLPGLGGESGIALKNAETVSRLFRERDYLSEEPATLPPRSIEYGSYIIEARETGIPFDLNANVMNSGYIANLPDDCCVEVPVTVDSDTSDGLAGVHPHSIGSLPAQLAALCQTNVTVQTLCVEAYLKRDIELLFHAMALDPLVSAVLTLKEIREMTRELIAAEREYLDYFEGQELAPRPDIVIPAGTKPVETPLDPAHAVVRHLKEIAERARKQ